MEIIEQKPRRTLISLTPLIDVVFILLVFFMLVSSFVEWKTLTLAVGEAEPLPINNSQQSIVLVDFDQRYSLNDQAMALAAIATTLKERIQQQADHTVLIQPVNDLPLQALVIVLTELNKVAGDNISLVKGANNGN